MKFSAPKQITWWIAVIIWIIALVGAFVEAISGIKIGPQGLHFWLALLSGLILALGTLLEGL